MDAGYDVLTKDANSLDGRGPIKDLKLRDIVIAIENREAVKL